MYEDKLYNIYVIENDAGYIKIGITKNFENRLKTLSNSNSGGHKIINTYISPKTLLYTIERGLHTKYATYRKEGEWFYGISFEEVVQDIKKLFDSEEYKWASQIRENYYATTKHNLLKTPEDD